MAALILSKFRFFSIGRKFCLRGQLLSTLLEMAITPKRLIISGLIRIRQWLRTLANAENPSLQFGLFSLVHHQWRIEISIEDIAPVNFMHPGCGVLGIVLVQRMVQFQIASLVQNGIILHNHGLVFRHFETVKRLNVLRYSHIRLPFVFFQ